MKFDELNIDERILRAVEDMGFEETSPIQTQAIPAVLEGIDVIGQAQTGTGKTAAYSIPMLQKINPDVKKPQAIVLCPTRELAVQVAEEIRKLAKYMSDIKVLPVYGGQEIVRQIKSLKAGVQIIVGTPGRVMDHMRRKTVKFDSVSMVILDEADEMLDMGFREDMETILTETPEERQTVLFSATMPKPIMEIARKFQKDAKIIQFVRKELTKKQLKKYKKDSDKTDESGEKSVHSLKNDSDRESIRVVTQKDSTGSEEIKNIVISPNGASKKISNIKGYYCELQWVQTTDNEENRYAVLTYNGIRSQTFVVFDTKLKEIYYKQEDGNSALSSVFDRYNGNQNDIAFNKDDLVVYTLQEKENDVLKIGFAANAKDNVVVKGSYKYDVEKKNQYDFNYSQTSAANAGSGNNDTGASATESPTTP